MSRVIATSDGNKARTIAVASPRPVLIAAGLRGAKGATGDSFRVDATGTLVNRAQFDAEDEGFVYLATDTGDLYFREGAAGGWSGAVPFQGPPGDSAYQVAVDNGFVGTAVEWLAALQGAQGDQGRGITSLAINVSGHLVVTYTDAVVTDLGLVVGANGATGRGIASMAIDGSNHLIITYTDATTEDAGLVPSGGGGAWGSITGTLANQTDLQAALNSKATSAQGALADTAVQPADLATVATTGAYADITGKPTLGTAAATASTDYATAAQGALADTAVQPAALTAAMADKVDKVVGKQLSTEDYTTAEKSKLGGVATNANNYIHPNHTGDVTSAGDGAQTIANNAVTNSKAADMAANTIKGRATAGTGDPEDLTAAQVRTLLNVADGATANSTDAALRDRATHTGAQAISTVTGLQTALDSKTGLPAVATFTGNKTLALTDINTYNVSQDGTAQTVNLPAQATVAWTADAEIHIEQGGTGTVTVTGATGVTVNGVSAGSFALAGQFSVVTLKRVASNSWTLIGSLSGTTVTEFLTAGDGVTRDANSVPGDDPHWVEITNNPASGAGNQLLRLNSYGASGYGNNVHFCRYFGTEASPLAVGDAAFLMSTGFRAHDGTALSGSAAAFQVLTTEAWSGTGHGCKFQWQTTPNGSTTRTQAMELGASWVIYRNGGVGTTPPAWHANYKVIEFGLPGCAMRGHVSTPECTMTANAYYDTSYKYGSTAAASIYQQVAGTHNFLGAPSGSAGAAVTFTQIMLLSAVTGTGYNAAAAALKINQDAATSRSINAAGTVNASGADYAEYMRKAAHCGDVAKGQIVGITRDGEVTDKWSAAVTFMVKSTAPAYVGGDTWSAPVGEAPEQPGPDASGDDWVAYQDAYAAFNLLLEVERLKHDRIAFAGQVPVNVLGAFPGDYIVPVIGGDGISVAGTAVRNPTFDQYISCVGQVIAVEPDGRARIIVRAC